MHDNLVAELTQLLDHNRDEPAEVLAKKLVAMHLERLTRKNLEARVLELATQNMTRSEIARATGFSESGVYRMLRRSGLSKEKKHCDRLTAEERSVVVDMVKAGVPATVIAKRVNYARTSLYRIPEFASRARKS